MTNLFSIFDPQNSQNYSLNWLSIFIPTIFFPLNMWIKSSKTLIFFKNIYKNILKEFNQFKYKKKINIINLLILFFLMSMMNFFGLFPYIFTPSSHLSITLPISLTLWLTIIMFNWLNKYYKFMAHFVPLNTPPTLMIFMVLIETISNIIRPMTLAIRLTANMIAGHLLLCLLGSTGSSLNISLLPLMIIVQLMLYILELAVAIIQSYVFMTLMSLYFNEL